MGQDEELVVNRDCSVGKTHYGSIEESARLNWGDATRKSGENGRETQTVVSPSGR